MVIGASRYSSFKMVIVVLSHEINVISLLSKGERGLSAWSEN